MPSAQQFSKLLHDFLKSSPAFSSFPSSLLLIGLEELMEIHLSCTCSHAQNIFLIMSIFIGPFLFIFALMFILLRPCKYKCPPFSANNPNESTAENDQENAPNANENEEDQQNLWKALGHCLIPPVMWIIILLLDGDYLACGLTGWEGDYVFHKPLNKSWCEPLEQAIAGHRVDQRRIYQQNISFSKAIGYAVFAPFGLLIVVFMGIYDCCTSKKSGCCDVENSGCGWRKIFALCTCCIRPDATPENLQLHSVRPNTTN